MYVNGKIGHANSELHKIIEPYSNISYELSLTIQEYCTDWKIDNSYHRPKMKNLFFLLSFFFLSFFAQGHSKTPLDGYNVSIEVTARPSDTLEQRKSKSAIEITSPNTNTVWKISEPAQIEWKTSNIDSTKSIRFFLARDDMVVQELGTFKNTFGADGIQLAKNIGSGDTYQVVGIELFPDDKYQVAKFATSYFSIQNAAADARKAKSNTTNTANNRKKEAEVPDRNIFQGRKISYTKELVFNSTEISVSIWDHGRQDGDIVSIYLNGETIISKHNLTYRKKNIAVKLNSNKPNDLFLYAHNLGKAPPNTVSIEITDGTASEKIILNSDLKSCEAVLISVNK